jgi:GT2 family glycosyltransferase
MNPKITLIIRTSSRPELFKRCLDSIRTQTYPAEVLVGYDNPDVFSYVPSDVRAYAVKVTQEERKLEYFYDLYCNSLMQLIGDGWFCFVDDDDYLHSPTVLEDIAPFLSDPDRPVICQFLRYNNTKPNKHEIAVECIKEGKIGLPCLFLHAKHKNLARLDGKKAGDYRFIKAISEQLKCRYVEKVVVETDRRSWGKMEE